MTSEDFFYTIEAPTQAPELKIKGSRFIADVFPVSSKAEIERHLGELRKEFYDASHHCFAYRLGADGLLLRAADDGEPSGTAGKPILLVLTSQKLTDVLLVVTRYFGGTKLGTGGLARAYAEAAQQAISLSRIQRVYLTDHLQLQVHYEDLLGVERLIASHEGKIEEAVYLASVSLRVAIRRSKTEHFKHALIDAFHGRVEALPHADTHSAS